MIRRLLQTLAVLSWLALSAAAHAHKPSDSYLMITQPQIGSALYGQWDIALRDLEHAVGIDANADGDITWGELKARRVAVMRYAFSHLLLEGIARGSRDVCAARLDQLLYDTHVDGGYAVIEFTADCPVRPAQLAIHYSLLFDLDPNHRGLVEVGGPTWSTSFVLAQSERTVTVTLGAANRWTQFRAFLQEGIWHIWTGYDHILFLLTLLFPAVVLYRHGRWQARESLHDALMDVLKVVTAFTLAHSLTLSLAVNGWVKLPSRLVESGIALTVLTGALNILVPVVRERRWAVAFAFGLIHGLGFASVLNDLGLHAWNLALALVSFNAGVEVGQLAIVLVVVPAAFILRESWFYRRAFMPAGAAAIGVTAAYWFALRALGLAF